MSELNNNNHNSAVDIARIDYVLLPLVMILAFYLAFLPHSNSPYPVHIDEWWHMAYAKATLRAGSTSFADPFFGKLAETIASNLEAGFDVFWGLFCQISGVSWMTIFRYGPAVIFMFTVLSVYVMARRQGFGWEAALCACLMPTTVGILGPGFLVPVALGLMFMPLSVFVLLNFRTVWSYVAAFVFISFLLVIHAPTAIGVVIILGPYILLSLRGEAKHSLGVMLTLALPFLLPFPWIFGMLAPTGAGLLVPQSVPSYLQLPVVVQTYGYLPVALCLLGAFVLAIRGGKENYGLVLGLLALMLILVVFFTFHYGISVMYERGLTYMMLFMSAVAGAGLMAIRKLSLPPGTAGIGQYSGQIACLILVVVTLVNVIPVRQNTPYYRMIDDTDYEAFVWIKEHVADSYSKAVVDPWKATAFTAITEKKVQARIHSAPQVADTKVYDFLAAGAADTSFLRQNGVSLVYSRDKVSNPDLTEVRQFVYLLK